MTGTRRLAETLARHPAAALPVDFIESAIESWGAFAADDLRTRKLITAISRYQASGSVEYWHAACEVLAEIVAAEIEDMAREVH